MPTYDHLEQYIEGTERRTIRIPKSKAQKPNVSHPPETSSPPRSGRTVANDRAFLLFSFVLSMCGTLVFLIGFSCPHWSKTVNNSYTFVGITSNGTEVISRGLWRTCTENEVLSLDSCLYPEYASWQKAVQAMETLALIVIVVVLAFCVYRLLHGKPRDAIPHMVFTFAAAIFMMIGLIVWGTYATGSPDFCVYLVSAALILFTAAGFVIIAEYTRSRNIPEEEQPLGAGSFPSQTPPPTAVDPTPASDQET